MNLDPDLLRLVHSAGTDSSAPLDWAAAREAGRRFTSLLAGPDGAMPVGAVEEHVIDGPGGALPLRIYRPLGEAVMTVIHLHGGGWTMGDLDGVDHTVRRMARRLDAIVVSCTYRLAPEHPFPAAYQDALAAVRWTLSQIRQLGGDAGRVAIAGDSAGGNLAAAVTIALRDLARVDAAARAPALPALRAQLLLYPAVDLRPRAYQAASCLANRDPSFSAGRLAEFISAYLDCGPAGKPDRESDRETDGDWRISPLAAADLSGLPPALVVVATVDILRDQAVQYAARLEQAGVDTELIEFAHLCHGFAHVSNVVPAAAAAFDDVLARFNLLMRAPAPDSPMPGR